MQERHARGLGTSGGRPRSRRAPTPRRAATAEERTLQSRCGPLGGDRHSRRFPARRRLNDALEADNPHDQRTGRSELADYLRRSGLHVTKTYERAGERNVAARVETEVSP